LSIEANTGQVADTDADTDADADADADADTRAPPPHDDSRRLTGPNREFAVPAVTLVPLGPAAADDTALQAWTQRVQALCTRLGWPAVQAPVKPAVRRAADGRALALSFTAPPQALFTATEVNEWAWERSADAHTPLAAQGFAAGQPASDDIDTLARHFAARAAEEASPPLQRLLAAAHARDVPVVLDDDSLSLGHGQSGRTWPRAALPLPLDVPWQQLQAVPLLLVTGSNGKTTTTRLLAAMARAAGFNAGLSSTEGVWVDGQPLAGGDWAGPAGARAVLRHPAVTWAVLETARGGLLRRGLAVDRADVAVVTNISADHLGEYGVQGLDDIAEAKLVVAHALAPTSGHPAGGVLVLNGADAVLMRMADQLPQARAPRRALFARDADHPLLQAHRRAGGATCGVRDGRLWLQLPRPVAAGADAATTAGTVDLGDVHAMPLSLGGAAPHNIENLAAAALAAHAAGLPLAAIAQVLQHFGANPADNPGRLERHTHRGATVLLDYAHNPDGLAQLLAVARALLPNGGRLRLLLGQAGNRDDDAITALAHTAAAARPDQVVVKELPAMLRGRAPGDVPALLLAGLQAAGLAPAAVQRIDDERAAAQRLLADAGPGDVVVLPVHAAAVRGALLRDLACRGTDAAAVQ
jgi:UDP-N-acetylmuramyl tripeptide synthase